MVLSKRFAQMRKAGTGITILCLMIFVIFCMSSCATDRVAVTKIEYAVPSGQILQSCPDVELRYSTNGELLMSLIELNTQYQICSARMDAVIQYFENLKTRNNGEQ